MTFSLLETHFFAEFCKIWQIFTKSCKVPQKCCKIVLQNVCIAVLCKKSEKLDILFWWQNNQVLESSVVTTKIYLESLQTDAKKNFRNITKESSSASRWPGAASCRAPHRHPTPPSAALATAARAKLEALKAFLEDTFAYGSGRR